MLLEKLKLTNFRQFKHEETIEFSTDKDSNITLIIGNNTSGKSTILQSFLWCFYGLNNFGTHDELFNKDIALEMNENEEKDIVVELEMSHENKFYTITRMQKCRKKNGNVTLVGSPVLKIDVKD